MVMRCFKIIEHKKFKQLDKRTVLFYVKILDIT